MNPDYGTPQSIDPAVKNRRLLAIAAILFGLVVVVVIIFSVLLAAKYPDYALTKTPLNKDLNFSHLEGSDLYSYNGLAFTKTNLKTGQVTILNKGIKLPVPKAMYWAGSQGALINFDHSFTLTKVSDQLRGTDAEFDTALASSMTWYFNFSNGSLRKVSDLPVVAKQAVFSPADHGFYYVPSLSDEGGDALNSDTSPVRFYNIDTNQDKEFTTSLRVVGITYFAPCADTTYKLCVIAQDEQDARQLDLYGVTANGQKTALVKSSGRLIPTNSNELFVTTDQDAGQGSENNEDASYTDAPAKLYNVKDESSTNLGFTIAGEPILPYIFSAKDFYALGSVTGSSNVNQYQATGKASLGNIQIKNFPIKNADGSDFSDGLRDGGEYGSDGVTLVTNVDGTSSLFAPKDTSTQVPSTDTKTAKIVIDACVKTNAKTSEYFDDTTMFKVYFADDAKFSSSIAAFSDCVIKANSKVLIGYNFYFGAIDPFNDRITSD